MGYYLPKMDMLLNKETKPNQYISVYIQTDLSASDSFPKVHRYYTLIFTFDNLSMALE